MLTYHFVLNTKPNKNGEHSINIRAILNRQAKYMACGIGTKLQNWDKIKKRVKKKDIESLYKNSILSAYDKLAKDTILRHLVKNKPLTLNGFIDALKNKTTYSFTEFAGSIHSDKSTSITAETLKNYGHQLNKIKEFNKDFNLYDVDIQFINNYAQFLRTTKSNSESTVSKGLTYLKMILQEAFKRDLIDRNPFVNYKIKAIKSRDEFLSKSDITEIENLRIQSKGLTKNELYSLDSFLFSCYTGISFTDLKNLRMKDIKDIELNGKKYFYLTNERQKTSTPFTTPLTKKAVELINFNRLPNAPIFNMFDNQVVNRHLKSIKSAAKIKTNITFHLARHTYATININNGISQKALMASMGHKSKKINDIYSKIQLEFLIQEFLVKNNQNL